jgi:hypothetical protein
MTSLSSLGEDEGEGEEKKYEPRFQNTGFSFFWDFGRD